MSYRYCKCKSDQSRAADIIRYWLRNRSTLEYLSVWEQLYNPDFKVLESEHFKKQPGLLTFTPSVSEWVEQTGAVKNYLIPQQMQITVWRMD